MFKSISTRMPLTGRAGAAAFVLAAGLAAAPTSALAQALTYTSSDTYAYRPDMPSVMQPEAAAPEADDLSPALRRQLVSYTGGEPAGTIIIDTPHTFLYLVLGGGQAVRYGIGVGREGFTWSGVQNISRKAEWPDWIPPAEMIARQPYLPRWVGGGPGNPLGARALYLGNSDYRIHGTNDPTSIGKHVSSGCIRLRNADIIDLYNRVGIGTRVVVLPNDDRSASFEGGRNASISSTPARVAPQTLSAESAAPAQRTGMFSGIY